MLCQSELRPHENQEARPKAGRPGDVALRWWRAQGAEPWCFRVMSPACNAVSLARCHHSRAAVTGNASILMSADERTRTSARLRMKELPCRWATPACGGTGAGDRTLPIGCASMGLALSYRLRRRIRASGTPVPLPQDVRPYSGSGGPRTHGGVTRYLLSRQAPHAIRIASSMGCLTELESATTATTTRRSTS